MQFPGNGHPAVNMSYAATTDYRRSALVPGAFSGFLFILWHRFPALASGLAALYIQHWRVSLFQLYRRSHAVSGRLSGVAKKNGDIPIAPFRKKFTA